MTNQIFLNDSNIEKASEDAIKYSKIVNMEELRKSYKPIESQYFTRSDESIESKSATADMAPIVDSYRVVSSSINYAQSERLVQKALYRK